MIGTRGEWLLCVLCAPSRQGAVVQDVQLERLVKLGNMALLMRMLRPSMQRLLAAEIIDAVASCGTKVAVAEDMAVLAQMAGPLVDAQLPSSDAVCCSLLGVIFLRSIVKVVVLTRAGHKADMFCSVGQYRYLYRPVFQRYTPIQTDILVRGFCKSPTLVLTEFCNSRGLLHDKCCCGCQYLCTAL
jgi:hypothetical protein